MVDANRKILLLHPENYDSIQVIYQRYPDWLVAERAHRKPLILTDNAVVSGSQTGSETATKTDDGNVTTDGILLRGISFGNAQDLVLNSSLNLRMNGQISKTMAVEAAVTDQEFPFQPEGTTSSLQDFDRIYVKLTMPKIAVLLGDHAFVSPTGALFMKYAKKDRGLQLMGTDTLKKMLLKWEASAALARGRFNRNEINGVEGQQGPYRLQGARGEQFIIIVSGTEVVYLDGKRMERGLQSDYIMDYNTGELTFTPKHIINAYSRIVVEFQYSDRAYTRSVAGANTTFISKKWELLGAVYSEQDAKNQPIQQDLQAFDSSSNRTAREILQDAGDNVSTAVLSTVKPSTIFSTSNPNYIRRDTGTVQFYEYIELPDTHKIFYSVGFTYVGAGKGHYVLRGNVANGKTYKYVGEISGVPAGDYEPVTLLRSPNRITMAETGVKFKPRKGTEIATNIAVSSNDKNTFSGINDADNTGMAAHLSVSDFRNLGGKDSLQNWYVKSRLDAENTSAHFTSIERYRDVEFGRQWNRSLYNPENGLDPQGSRYIKANSELGNGNIFNVQLSGGSNSSAGNQSAFGAAGMNYRFKNYFINPVSEISKSTLNTGENNFNRLGIDFGYRAPILNIVLNALQEKSLFQNALGEKLNQSYGFTQQGISLQHNIKQSSLAMAYSSRINSDIYNFNLTQSVHVQNANLEWNYKSKKQRFFKIGASLRTMDLLDTVFRNKYATENHFAGRLEYNFIKLLKIFSGNIYYQSISGREQQRQYSYFEVPAGQGYYTWIDFNANGIKEVNEFQETAFKDQAKYVRLLIPTGTYIKAQNTDFTGNLIAAPDWSKKTKLPKFSNRLTWNYSGKSTDIDWVKRTAPFLEKTASSGILAMNAFLRNQVEIESKDGNYLVQYTVQNRSNKLILTSGFDTRNALTNTLFLRGNVGSKWQIKNALEKRKSDYSSEYLPQNNFNYTHLGIEPAITWQPSSRLRITAMGKSGSDRSPGLKVADLLETGIQVTKTLGKGGILDMKVTSLKAKYYLTNGTPLSYDVLQGFSPGQNFRGTADLRFSASRNIQMVFSYEGRKTADAKFIHIGRAEARYLF